ncbi:iron reductase [Laetiporus sulphureus 93-53]|uniref:ferric-chelate reductase (NADPH) n=1 Tax=Laetiporus sulphureus 93-53 TaxID=1314785 RepID=A0A165EBL6_9APHY|nr:iron reductase [Laetiporus sulphureus 93-53]KZT06675.1 iron reductase [Laetiporus sulphureus 93-53]
MAQKTNSAAAQANALKRKYANDYPKQVWYLVACFLFTISLCQFGSWVVSRLSSKKRSSSNTDAEAGASIPPKRFSIRNLPAAIVNTYRVMAFRWTLELGSSYTLNLAEVFVTCGYIIALFVWEFVNTTDPTTGQKFSLSWYGNRAGNIASAQLTLVTALGCKNNVVSYITGISYDKLNYVHRMTARVCFVMLWVHTANWLTAASWSEFDRTIWFLPIGMTAMVAFSILIVFSIRPVRDKAYEFFFITHFLMVFIFLLGGYFHAWKERKGSYIWPSFLIWGLDRFIRFMRMVVFNHLYFSWSKKRAHFDAQVELLSPNFIRVRIARPLHFHWKAGQTAYLTMPSVSFFPTESHPFTIASVETQEAAPITEKQLKGDAPYWRELVFLINVRDGFTKRLKKRAENSGKAMALVDGPYGFTPDLDNDDTVVLVAGGSGVAFTLSTFLGLVENVRTGKSACRKVVWIWAIREATHIDWVSDALKQALELAPPHLNVNILIHVTAGEPLPVSNQRAYDDDSIHDDSEGKLNEKNSTSISLLDYSSVRLCSGRPDLQTMLRDVVAISTGRLSVTVCGSQAVARACRNALRFPVSSPSSVAKGGPSVILHVESYGYA